MGLPHAGLVRRQNVPVNNVLLTFFVDFRARLGKNICNMMHYFQLKLRRQY